MDRFLKKAYLQKKVELFKLRDKKNIKNYEKKITPLVNKLIGMGFSPELVTTFSVLFSLIAVLLIINQWTMLGGVFVLLTGVTQFVDGVLAKHTNAQTKFSIFSNALADKMVDMLILFALAVYYYTTNYPLLLVTLLLTMVMTFNNYIVFLIKMHKILRKVDIAFYRPEFMAFLTLGLIFNLLSLFIVACLAAALFTTFTLLRSIQAHLPRTPKKSVFPVRSGRKKRK